MVSNLILSVGLGSSFSQSLHLPFSTWQHGWALAIEDWGTEVLVNISLLFVQGSLFPSGGGPRYPNSLACNGSAEALPVIFNIPAPALNLHPQALSWLLVLPQAEFHICRGLHPLFIFLACLS